MSGIEWRISPEEFEALISKLKFSAPGPDGAPSTAWKNGGDLAHDALFELYYFILDGGYLGDEFNHSLVVFLARVRKTGMPFLLTADLVIRVR